MTQTLHRIRCSVQDSGAHDLSYTCTFASERATKQSDTVHQICKHLHINFFSLCDRHEARHCLPFGCLSLLSFSLLLLIFQLDCQSTLCPLVAIEFSQ